MTPQNPEMLMNYLAEQINQLKDLTRDTYIIIPTDKLFTVLPFVTTQHPAPTIARITGEEVRTGFTATRWHQLKTILWRWFVNSDQF